MKKILVSIAIALCVCVPLLAYAAADAWSTQPDSISTATPRIAGPGSVYYHFDDATNHSTWMPLAKGYLFDICLDPDTTATTAGATVQIRRSISAASDNGSHVLLNAILTGTWPNDCIEDVAGGTSIKVVIVANSGSDAAVVSVRPK